MKPTDRDYQLLVLGGFVHNREAFRLYAPDLNEEIFGEPDLRSVFASMVATGPKFSIPDLAEDVDEYGGVTLLREIANAPVRFSLSKSDLTNDLIRRFAETTDRRGRRRQMKDTLSVGIKMLEKAPTKDDENLIASVVNELVRLQYAHPGAEGPRPYDLFLEEFYNRYKKIKANEPVGRTATSFKSFDKATGGGLPSPGLVIIAGPPGSGKTQLAWQMMLNVAGRTKKEKGKGVCVINSIEMLGVDLASRAVLSAVGIDSASFRLGGYENDPDAYKEIESEIERQKGLPLYIDDSSYLTSSMIDSRVTGLQAKHGKVILVISDYAEIVTEKGESEQQQVSRVFIRGKALSKRLGCTVMILSQVSRQVEISGTKIPTMRMLRNAGAAEAVGDMIIMTYSPNYYVESGVKLTPHPQMPPLPDTAYLIIAKHKEGPIGFLPMGWISTFSRWSDLGSKTKLSHYAD